MKLKLNSELIPIAIIIAGAIGLLGLAFYQVPEVNITDSEEPNETYLESLVLPEDYFKETLNSDDYHVTRDFGSGEKIIETPIYLESDDFHFRAHENPRFYKNESFDMPHLVVSSAIEYDTSEEAENMTNQEIKVPLRFETWVDVNKRPMTLDGEDILFSAYHVGGDYVTQIDYNKNDTILQVVLRSKFDYYDDIAKDAMEYMINQLNSNQTI